MQRTTPGGNFREPSATPRQAMPRTVWALGLVSFFMDVSSETIHALLPLFLTTTLGVSVAMVGVIDGIAESTAAISNVVVTLARFSEAFLVLKATAEGLPLALAPLVLVIMNLVYALGAYPAGALADARSPVGLLRWGLASLIAADMSLALFPGLGGAFLGIALWGLHMALTQGLLAALVAEQAPEHIRGSAFGLFNLATGVAMLCASVLAGVLWDLFGADATFLAGAGFAALAGLVVVRAPRALAVRQRGDAPNAS